MEPERKIEKWLRVYAKKRRAKADADFRLHPDARRLLQDEIARDYSKTDDDEEDSVSIWELIRQQWAFLLSFAVCIFLFGLILLPILDPGAKKALSLSLNKTGQLGAPPSRLPAGVDREMQSTLADEVTNYPLLKTDAPNSYSVSSQGTAPLPEIATTMSGRTSTTWVTKLPPPFTIAGGSFSTAAPASPPVVETASPMAASVPEGAFPSAPPPLLTKEEPTGAGLPQGQSATQTQAPDNGSALPTWNSSASSPGSAASRPIAGTFQTFYKNIVAEQKMPLLANFQVQQNGNAIRIVDEDGSVYEGSLKVENQNGNRLNGIAQSSQTFDMPGNSGGGGGGGFGGVGGESTLSASVAKDSSATVRYYFFQVSGTNQTLQQNVMFSGHLLANIIATKKVEKNFGMTDGLMYGAALAADRIKPEATNQLAPLPWTDLRIAGMAVLNHTNRIEISAVPVVPPKN